MTTDWTRRDFVKGLTMAGAAGVLPASAWSMSPRRSQELKIGLVGCGGRGTGAAVQALRADEHSVLWAVGDAFTEPIGKCLTNALTEMQADDDEAGTTHATSKLRVPEERQFVGFDAYQRVIDSGVDVVLLTTPPAFRPEHLRASIEAGAHVFCEKPVAVDAAGVRSVLESARIARQRKLSLMTGFCWRYQDQVRETFEQLRSGGIGDVHTIQTTYNTTGWIPPKPRQPAWSDTEFQLRNWHYFHPISGDHIVEQAVHAIDWIAWAMGDQPPERCWAVGGRQVRAARPETGNVFDHFAVTYEYPGGVRAYHTCRHWPNTPSDNSMYVLGSKGRCTMQPWTGGHSIEGETPWKGSAAGNDMYQREHDVLFEAIRSGSPVNEGEAMAHSTLLAIMGREAAYTGKTITWEDALASEARLNDMPWTMGDRPTPAVAVPGSTGRGS